MASTVSVGQRGQVQQAGVEGDVVGADLLAQVGAVGLEHRVDVDVLVLGVAHQQVDGGLHVAGEGVAAGPVGRVEATGLAGHGEELGADALVDVLVEVEDDPLERGGLEDGGLVGDGHGVLRGGWFVVVTHGAPRSGGGGPQCSVTVCSELPNLDPVPPGPVLSDELAAFLEGGCALIVGTVGADGRPHAGRAWGIEVLDAEAGRLRLLLDAADGPTLANLAGDDPRLACTGADVRTLHSRQLKGRSLGTEPATGADRARAAALLRRRSSPTSRRPTANPASCSSRSSPRRTWPAPCRSMRSTTRPPDPAPGPRWAATLRERDRGG